VTAIRIESPSRWDALALTRRLDRYHWYLVAPAETRWDVYVEVERPLKKLPDDLRRQIDDWLVERRLNGATIHADGGDFRVSPPS
jgi:hypothetical protein